MKTRIEKIWMGVALKGYEIRIDFDNDRHHAITINPPAQVEQVAEALKKLANQILNDKNLK